MSKKDFVTNLPFSWVEHPLVQECFHELRPSFKLPPCHELNNPPFFLSIISHKVLEAIKFSQFISCTCDSLSLKQGDAHIINFQVCRYKFSHFIGMKVLRSARRAAEEVHSGDADEAAADSQVYWDDHGHPVQDETFWYQYHNPQGVLLVFWKASVVIL